MDPLSITVGALTIAKLAAQCVLDLSTWVGEIKTVDDRIEAFCSEIHNLSNTLDALTNNLRQPAMLQAAEEAAATAGGDLWAQIKSTLEDCEATMNKLKSILDGLRKPAKFFDRIFRRPVRQFRESLEQGTISVLRERILFFTAGLALPMQMMHLVVQIQQAAIDGEHQQQVIAKMDMINGRVAKLDRHLQTFQFKYKAKIKDVSTAEYKNESAVYTRMQSYVSTAARFISNTSSSKEYSSYSSNTSPPSAYPQQGLPTAKLGFEQAQTLLKSYEYANTSVKQTFNSEMSQSSAVYYGLSSAQKSVEDFDLDLQLARQYLTNGMEKFNAANWEIAESNFRKALEKGRKNDLIDKLEMGEDEIKAFIARCCMCQRKFEDVRQLSRDILDQKPQPDRLLFYGMHSMLARVYFEEKKYKKAETMCLSTVKGYRKHVGSKSGRYFESIELLIAIYHALGDQAEVSAWKSILQSSAEYDKWPRKNVTLDNLSMQLKTGKLAPISGAFTIKPKNAPIPTAAVAIAEHRDMLAESGLPAELSPEGDNLGPKLKTFRDKYIYMQSPIYAHSRGPKSKFSLLVEDLLSLYNSSSQDLPNRIMLQLGRQGRTMLLKSKPTVSLLHFFATLPTEHLREVQFLISQGHNTRTSLKLDKTIDRFDADVLIDGESIHDLPQLGPAELAIYQGHSGILRLLLTSSKISNDMSYMKELSQLAYRRKQAGLLNVISAQTAGLFSPAKYGERPLRMGIRCSNLASVMRFAQYGRLPSNIDERWENGRTALYFAVELYVKPLQRRIVENHILIITTLVACGADVNAQTFFGDTPLALAKYSRRFDIVKILERGKRSMMLPTLPQSCIW